MANLIENEFTSYFLNEDELLQGSLLTITQKQVIQNEIALMASEKINLEFDPNDPAAFAQAEAYKKGQMDALRYRIDCSNAAQEQLKEEGDLNKLDDE